MNSRARTADVLKEKEAELRKKSREKIYDKLLNVDCRTEKGMDRIKNYLLGIVQIEKAFKKYLEEYGYEDGSEYTEDIPLEILEKYLHQLSIRKKYQVINIQPYYGKDHDEFVFYTSSAKRVTDHVWIGNAYGKTVYETVAKLIVLIRKDMEFPRSSEGYKYE